MYKGSTGEGNPHEPCGPATARRRSARQVTFPIGPTVGKVVKLWGVAPVKFELEGLYIPVYPAHDGERFIVQFQIIPVVPAPIAEGVLGL